MSNYGTNMGKGNSYNGNTNVTNTVNINKSKRIIGITASISIVLVVVIALIINSGHKQSVIGKWYSDDGISIEFLSDGTLIYNDDYTHSHPDIYEVIDDEYLKIGEYNAAWIEYRYTYWNYDFKSSTLILTSKDNPDDIIRLTK